MKTENTVTRDNERLELITLSKSFGDKLLFSSLTYRFSETGLYLILGPSGCGKSTLLRLIAGLDTPSEGHILSGGASATTYAFQETRLFPALTAIKNVAEPLRAAGMTPADAEARAADALAAFDYHEGDFLLRPAALSGGMRQRVSLARAFAVPRPILLLDEPERGLDEHLREMLTENIRKEAAKRLVLLVTHTPSPYLSYATDTLFLGENSKAST